jgi:hypothetical protein
MSLGWVKLETTTIQSRNANHWKILSCNTRNLSNTVKDDDDIDSDTYTHPC